MLILLSILKFYSDVSMSKVGEGNQPIYFFKDTNIQLE